MPKRNRPSNKSSKTPPKRSRKRSKSDSSGQGSTPNSIPESHSKQVSPAVTALILAPFVAVLLYGGYMLIQAGQGGSDPVDPQPDTSVTKNDNGSTSNVLAEVETGPCHWQTDASVADQWDRIDDPSQDGWNTEVFNQRVTQQLKTLKKLLASPDKLNEESLSSLVAADVAVGVLRPEQPKQVWQDEQLQVYRAKGSDSDQNQGGNDRSSMVAALQSLASKYVRPPDLRSKIKVFRIQESDDYTETWQTVELFGLTRNGIEEENMVWRAKWILDDSGRFPLISEVTYDKYESVTRKGGPQFSDCTESIFSNNPRFQEQVLVGYNQILQRCQVNDYYLTLGNPGLTLGDVNNDGLDDIFVCQENGVPNMLFLQNPDGSLRDATDDSGANWLQNCRTALIVDLDNDGNNDLAVAYTGGVVVASGDGKGHFEIQRFLATSADVLVLTAADYDLDGRLDLFAGVYGAYGAVIDQQPLAAAGSGGEGFVYVDAKDGGKNSLFQNQCKPGEWDFKDVTSETKLDQASDRYAQAAAWADFDNDGDQDLYIANDFGPNNLFRNDLEEDGSRVFTDIAKEANAQDSASGMSVDWADFDRDGWQDLYVGNMYSYAGNRIAFQTQFKPDQSKDVVQQFQRFARGNSLMRNQGVPKDASSLQFDDQSLTAAVNRGRWAWGSRFADLNNDGWQDLVVANGFITAGDSGDL